MTIPTFSDHKQTDPVITKNWHIDSNPETLNFIHQQDINVSVYQRDTSSLTDQVEHLLEQHVSIRLHGNEKSIIDALKEHLLHDKHHKILEDIKQLLTIFKQVSCAETFRLFLTRVDTNMCRKFHTDINDLRLLCTYYGQGTQWLTDDNIDREALHSLDRNTPVVINENKIRQVDTGDVIILKGAIYPTENTKAAVHRSPSIEHNDESRLLLRIDTNEFLKFDV